MSAAVLTNVQLFVGGFECGGFSGEFDLSEETMMLEANNFGALGYTVKIPGLTTATGMVKGWADYASGGVNQTFNSASKGSQFAFSVLPTGTAAVVGDPAHFMRGVLSKLAMNTGATGEVAGFQMDISGDSAGVDGVVGAPLVSRTTTGFTGTGIQLGAVSATQRLWVAQHVTASAGTNLVTTIESDNAVGFPSPVTVATLSTVSAIGWQFTSVAGPFTDDWFRVKSTIATSTFSYAVVIGVD